MPHSDELKDLQVEMIDRFGLLPQATKWLIRITELKLKATPLGITRIDANQAGGRVIIGPNPNVDSLEIIKLIQTQPESYQLDGQDKLRFTKDLTEREIRIDFVNTLLDAISPKG